MSLQDVWDAAAKNPFEPTVSKDRQFFVGFTLLFVGMKGFLQLAVFAAKQLSDGIL